MSGQNMCKVLFAWSLDDSNIDQNIVWVASHRALVVPEAETQNKLKKLRHKYNKNVDHTW